MSRLTLSSRLVLVYSALLLGSAAAFAWLQIRSSDLEAQKLVQLLSVDVADHIAERAEFADRDGLTQDLIRQLFDELMTVNPSVEVYVLDPSGRIVGDAAPPGHVKRERVDLGPIERWLDGQPAPIFGDDPRSATGRKVFSAARLEQAGQLRGFIYVILLGEARDLLARDVAGNQTLRTTLAWMTTVTVLGILVGTIALRRITRPLRALAESMHELDIDRLAAERQTSPAAPERDEIAILKLAFSRMAARIADQWHSLRRQDAQRREFVANVSHDLRTPLTSLQGYLETLDAKRSELSEAERSRYLAAARALSEKLGSLAGELLDLARFEHDGVAIEKEPFSIVDLVQDVFEKLFVLAEEKQQTLTADIPGRMPNVVGSVQMIERVLTNLVDNAIRHTPEGTEIVVRLSESDGAVEVCVHDDGPGLPADLCRMLRGETTPSGHTLAPAGGGLGLRIVARILDLHGSRLEIGAARGTGASLCFRIATTEGPI